MFSGGGGGDVCNSGTEHNRKLKFSMETHLTQEKHYIYHASMSLDNVDVLYLEDWNVYRPVLKNLTANKFFLRKRLCLFYFLL